MKVTNHFYSIDSFRAIAAIVVVIGHIELIKNQAGMLNWIKLVPDGHLGVVFFFVLSGYLITRLLLLEREKTKTIHIKQFYVRRILRIWPLYYFILILSALIFNYVPSWRTFFLCFTLFPNIAHIIGSYWMVSPQIWSIGVEEQFYLAWPFFLKFQRNNIVFILIIFIILYTLMPNIIWLIAKNGRSAHAWFLKPIYFFFYTAKFNCMAWGGLLAILQNRGNKIINFLNNRRISIFLIISFFLFWFLRIELLYFNDELFAFIAGLVIITSTNKKYLIFNNKILDYLGKISYGIYMYHWIILKLLIPYFAKRYLGMNILYENILIYFLSIISIIILASLSYHFFELHLLKLKNKIFSVV